MDSSPLSKNIPEVFLTQITMELELSVEFGHKELPLLMKEDLSLAADFLLQPRELKMPRS